MDDLDEHAINVSSNWGHHSCGLDEIMKRIKQFLLPFVRRTMSPRVVQHLRYAYWWISIWLPGTVVSRFVKRTPQIHRIGETVSSRFAKRIEQVNLLAPTKMCQVMTKHGSDKGRLNDYTPLYSAMFMERRNYPIRILELGLGTNNPQVPSNMGIFGAPGASLRGWREIFPHAIVCGADIDRAILFEEDRIKTFYCDQLDRSAVQDLWLHPELQGGADIIIEDGLHTFEANISFLEGSLEHLRPGGIYVAEDIGWDCFEAWLDRWEAIYSERYPKYEFVLVVLAKHGYNNLVVVRRAAD